MPAALSNVSVNRLIGTNVTVTGLRAGQLQPRQVLATPFFPGQKIDSYERHFHVKLQLKLWRKSC